MEGAGAPHARIRILAVDDEPDVLETLCDVLRELEDVQVDGAASLATALVLLRDGPYDVVVADERLRDGNGVDLLRWVSAEHPTTARVLISAHDDFPDLVRAVNEARIHLFVPKPWDPGDLGRRVRRLLLEQAVLHERLRAFARATTRAAPAAPPPAPAADASWPPS